VNAVNYGFYTMLRYYRVAVQLATSQAVLSSVELLRYKHGSELNRAYILSALIAYYRKLLLRIVLI
jgi:hypothetical protein